MKNLKFVFIFAVASTVSLAIYSCSKENIEKKSITQALEFRTLCPSYIDVAGCNPPSGATNAASTLVYEGCSIPFQVLMYKCSWGVYFEPPIIDWDAVFSGVWTGGAQNKCTDLANKMLNLSIQGKGIELNALLLDIKKQASLIAQKLAITFSSQNNINFFPCDGNNPPTTFSVVTQETKCTMFCQKIVTGTGIFISELLCGSGCCTRKTPFCVKSSGDIQYGTPIFENPAPCVNDNSWFYTMTCPAGFTSLEVCNTACSKI